MRKSPKDTQCPHCQRFFTKKGCREHQRHVRCSPSSTAKKRVFERARCKHCGKSFHSGNSLRVHVAGQHPAEYSRSPHSVKRHKAPLKRKSASKAEQRSTSPPAGRVERKRDDAQQQTDASTAFRTPADAERTRRIWEEAIRRQQLQKDKTGGRKHHAQSQDI